jgi:enoyl-CoA hydratase/carnithine racemase
MNGFDLRPDNGVWTLTMSNGENRIGSFAISEWNRALDQVENNGSGQVLVVTGTDKYWSTGLDLDEVNRSSHLERQAFMARIDALLARILTAPFVTVAALNGHTYAGGALVALAFDYRIMREDRGYFCLPSVEVQIPFTQGMAAMIADKIPQPTAHDLVVSGREIGGREAAELGVINEAVSAEDVLRRSLEIAGRMVGKDAQTLALVKRRMYPVSIGHLSRTL